MPMRRLPDPESELTSMRDRQRFERYCEARLKGYLLPLFADISLVLTLLATLIFTAQAIRNLGWNTLHPLTYLYPVLLLVLLVVHRLHSVRRRAPLMAYLIFALVNTFTLLGFLASGGKQETLTGLFFFLSSLGFLTLSIRHTLVLLAANSLLLYLALLALPPIGKALPQLQSLFGEWFALSCYLIAAVSALFNRWLFRHLLALQFLLGKRNRQLRKTLRSLEETENLLIQQRKHEALSLMAKGLLHEIVNPLNNASQALHYALSLEPDGTLKEALVDVDAEHQRINRLLSELVTFTRAPKPEQFQWLDLRSSVEEALHWCRHELKGVKIALQGLDGLKGRAHPQALQQVLINLVLNACSAMKSNPAQHQPALLILGRDESLYSILTLADNGVGMEASALHRIREAFVSLNPQPGRLGLGLNICEALLRHHGGRLEIDSAPGEGTRVSIWLPKQATFSGSLSD